MPNNPKTIVKKSAEFTRVANTKIPQGSAAYSDEAFKGVTLRGHVNLQGADIEALKRDSLLPEMNLVDQIRAKQLAGNLDYIDRNYSDLRELQASRIMSYMGLKQAELEQEFPSTDLEKEASAGSRLYRKAKEARFI